MRTNLGANQHLVVAPWAKDRLRLVLVLKQVFNLLLGRFWWLLRVVRMKAAIGTGGESAGNLLAALLAFRLVLGFRRTIGGRSLCRRCRLLRFGFPLGELDRVAGVIAAVRAGAQKRRFLLLAARADVLRKLQPLRRGCGLRLQIVLLRLDSFQRVFLFRRQIERFLVEWLLVKLVVVAKQIR